MVCSTETVSGDLFRAFPVQSVIIPNQVGMILTCLRVIDTRPDLVENIHFSKVPTTQYVNGDKSYVTQLIIFIALGHILSKHKKLSPSKDLDGLWHSFILDTKAYDEFHQLACVNFTHHVPEKKGSVDNREIWTAEEIEKFLNGTIPGFDKKWWYMPSEKPAADCLCGTD